MCEMFVKTIQSRNLADPASEEWVRLEHDELFRISTIVSASL